MERWSKISRGEEENVEKWNKMCRGGRESGEGKQDMMRGGRESGSEARYEEMEERVEKSTKI